jgi:sarcosine oxidase subunit alpha
MDVTDKDVKQCVAEGFDEMELLKRYATVGMGPCQGKMCGMNNIAACARATGKSIAETGTTTQRQPIQPVALGALAGPAYHPIRRTPLHQKHVELGAKFIDMGEWKRPLHYGVADTMPDGSDVDLALPDEYRAVREEVGIIDVSTLGKLEVAGPDAARLLDRVYTSEISRLRPGRTRYGIICDDSGVLLDDGTVTLLSPHKYLLTTTTGNLHFVEQWLTRQALGTGWNVHVTNVTAGYASINVAGPMARATLTKLTNLDISPAAFPYMGFARGEVAGVPAMLSRLGFLGEIGWEIHVPAECGEWLWEELLRAGEEFGITPFGVDTQRLLRLEKRHVIIGVDTDALASPLEVGLEELVRWNKPDFIGKKALEVRRQREGRDQLVGFVVEGDAVPLDGAAIVVGRRVGGRVTSCRRSPHVGKAIGLGWIIVEQSRPGTRLEIIHEDRPVAATVTEGAFYDPANERQKG